MKQNLQKGIILLYLMMAIALCIAQTDKQGVTTMICDSIPAIPQRIVDRMYQYQNTRSVYIQDWDPRGNGIYITTRFGETYQVHVVEKPGGMRRQITFFNEPVYYAYPCPDTGIHGFLYTTDKGGDEFTQIYYCNNDDGTYTLRTDGSSKNEDVVWANKGGRFIYSSTKRTGKDIDLYIQDVRSPEQARMVLKAQGAWTPLCWAPDDKKVLVERYISANESYLHTLDPATGKLLQINPSNEKIAYGGAAWAKNGKGLYVVSDEKSEFLVLRYYDIASGKSILITGGIPWNVMEIALSHTGDMLAFTVNEHGLGPLYILDTKTLQYRRVPRVPQGRVYNLRFDPSDTKLAFVVSSAGLPGDAFVYDVTKGSVEQWTFSEVGGLPANTFILPSIITYETFDSVNGRPREIPAFYFKPVKGKPPFPVLIRIHGGPESQYWPTFNPIVHYYLNELGIAVIAPNVRGSAGYGKTYLTLDNGYKREDAVRDIGKLLEWIKKQPDLDSSRIGVAGGSYGGYMALSSLVQYNDRLACGIDIYGISNFVTFLKNTQEYRRDLRRAEYGDERDTGMARYLSRISPLTNCDKITRPVFIFQGANDPRVPVSESQQMVAQIRKNKGTVWYMLATDEGHGFGKKRDQDVFDNAVALFLEKYLLRREAGK